MHLKLVMRPICSSEEVDILINFINRFQFLPSRRDIVPESMYKMLEEQVSIFCTLHIEQHMLQ